MVPTAKALRAEFPGLKIIWGGYFPTQHFEACLSSDLVDYIVRGHGEFAFLELVRSLRRGDPPPNRALPSPLQAGTSCYSGL